MSVDIRWKLCALTCVASLALWSPPARASATASGAEIQIAQASNQPPNRAQKDLDYWRRKAQEFAATAAATDSLTKKAVMAMLIDQAHKRAAEAQQTLDAIAKQPTTPPRTGPAPFPPVLTAPPRPPLAPNPAPAPPKVSGGPPPVNAGPSGVSNAECPRNAKERWDNPTSPEDMVQFVAEQFECDAPALRLAAEQARQGAVRDKQEADQATTALAKKVSADQAAEASQLADALDQVAGRLRERITWTATNIVPVAVPQTQDANAGLCPALTKPPARKDQGNDPYVMCDCVQEYLMERIAPLYQAMVGRIKPQTAFASAALYASTHSYAELFRLVTLHLSRNAFVAMDHCTNLLFLSENMRAVKAEDGPDPGFTPADLKLVQDSVYADLGEALADLWSSFYGEIGTGIDALTMIERDQEAVFAAKLHGMQKPTRGDLQAFCASDDSAAQARVNWLGREMSALAAAMRAARPNLSREVRLWQDFAARDGWPDRASAVSFGEMADRLQTSAHLLGWTGRENGIAAIAVGTESIDGVCEKWNPGAPGSVYMMVGNDPGARPTEGVPRAAPASVVNAMRNYDPPYRWDGPFTSAKANGIWLMLPLFEGGNESAVAFFSGADVTQHP